PASRNAPARSIGSMTWPGMSGEPGRASALGLGVPFDSGPGGRTSAGRAGGMAARAPGGSGRDDGSSPAPSVAKARRPSAGPIPRVTLFLGAPPPIGSTLLGRAHAAPRRHHETPKPPLSLSTAPIVMLHPTRMALRGITTRNLGRDGVIV